MNRDREAIARIVSEACVRWEGVAVSTKTILDDAVDAILDLPPAGGVEEVVGARAHAIIYALIGLLKEEEFEMFNALYPDLNSVLAALSPTTLGEES